MKKLYTTTFTLLLLVFSISLNAQTTDVITGLNQPSRIIIDNDIMYITDYGSGRLLKTDFTAQNPILDVVLDSLEGPFGLLINNNNELYITEAKGDSISGKISKFDINEAIPTLQLVVSGLDSPEAMFLKDEELFFAEYNGNRIAKIDITSINPIVTEIIGDIEGPEQLLLIDDFLYYSESKGNRISKIDIKSANPMPVEVIRGVRGPSGLLLAGDYLYIAEFRGNKISKIDITVTNPTLIDVVTGLSGPTDIVRVDNDLYIVEFKGNKISKFTDSTLSVNNSILTQYSLSIYPNPSTDFITIAGLNNVENYNIYNIIGNKINTGSVSENEKINVQNLNSGLYLMKFESGKTLKFIKQ